MRYAIVILVLVFFLFPFLNKALSPTNAALQHSFVENNLFLTNTPTVPKRFIVTVTGYSSSLDETDDDPFITASGNLVKDGTAASNFLPLGTAIKIPSIFGDKVFVITDRMNERYYYRVDIWFPSKDLAKEFGIHHQVLIEVLD